MIKEINKDLIKYDELTKKEENKTITKAEQKMLFSILKKVNTKLKEIEKIEKAKAKSELKKAKELSINSKKMEKEIKDEKSAKKAAKVSMPKPDYVQAVLISLGMFYISLGPLEKKITALSFANILKKQFPDSAYEGTTPKIEGNTLNFVDSNDLIMASFGFVKKEESKFKFGKVEPFVYKRYFFVREVLEPYYQDALKNYDIITKDEAEKIHVEEMKRKNQHFENIYNDLKKKENTSFPSKPIKQGKINELSVQRRQSTLQPQRILSKPTESDNDINLLFV